MDSIQPAPQGASPESPANASASVTPVQKPQHVMAASLKDILGFNPRKGESAPPLKDEEIVLSDQEIRVSLALNNAEVAALGRVARQRRDAAILRANVSWLSDSQKAERDEMNEPHRQLRQDRVHALTRLGTGNDIKTTPEFAEFVHQKLGFA